MISVAIIGILAATVGVEYQKNIIRSKAAEAPLALKNAYDASVLAVDKRFTARNGATCAYANSFVPITTVRSSNQECSSDFSYDPPSGSKAFVCHIFMTEEFAASNGNCSAGFFYGLWGTKTTLATAIYSDNGSVINYGLVSESPGYFAVSGGTSSDVASQYGVNVLNTFLVRAIGDIDGDSSAGSFATVSSSSFFSRDSFTVDELSTYARGMYVDANGDVQGASGIYKSNPLE